METATRVDMDVWDFAGPLSPIRRPDAGEHWVTISALGVCNQPVKISEHVSNIMRIRVQDWLNYDVADYSAFSMCQLTGANCAAGFVADEGVHVPVECPFSVVKDEITGKHGCCYTVLADGVCVMDLLDIINAYYDGEGPAPRKTDPFRQWARAMLNFYRLQLHGHWEGGEDGGN